MTRFSDIMTIAIDLETGLSASSFYPLRHMARAPKRGGNSWQNDGQNFVYDPYEGLWRTWALVNPDWKAGNGFPETHWGEYVGPSLDQMVPTDIRIDKSSSPDHSLWSGSCFVDWHNHLGKGYGAAWYFVSAPTPQNQSILLYVAPRLGVDPSAQGVVIPFSAVPQDLWSQSNSFRDCRVFWDDDHNQLVLAATCGETFGIFTSTNGLDWTFRSSVQGPGPLVECPNMMKVKVRDVNGLTTNATRWCIIGCIQGYYAGSGDSYENCALWVGNWDGTTFVPDNGYPLIWDYGPDSYAATAGQDDQGNTFVGTWLGSWAYCGSYMPFQGFQNIQGMPRQCWLQPDTTGLLRLYTAPLASDMSAYRRVTQGSRQTISASNDYIWPDGTLPTGKCFRLDIVLTQQNGVWPGTTTLKLRTGTVNGAYYHTDLVLNGQDGTITLDRSGSGPVGPGSSAPGAGGPLPDSWTKPYRIPASLTGLSETRVKLTVLMDACSLEAFVNDGLSSLSSLIFPPDACQNLTLTASSAVTAAAQISHY